MFNQQMMVPVDTNGDGIADTYMPQVPMMPTITTIV